MNDTPIRAPVLVNEGTPSTSSAAPNQNSIIKIDLKSVYGGKMANGYHKDKI